VLPVYLKDLGLKGSDLGILVASFALAQMIISPFGQINTSTINTKSMTFFDDSSTNNVDLFEQIQILN
jgi:hypothetical protein